MSAPYFDMTSILYYNYYIMLFYLTDACLLKGFLINMQINNKYINFYENCCVFSLLLFDLIWIVLVF